MTASALMASSIGTRGRRRRAGSMAAQSASMAGEGAITVSMTVNYLVPAREALIGEGRVIRAGRSLASLKAPVTDKAGRTVAHAIGTLRIIARLTRAECHRFSAIACFFVGRDHPLV